MMDAKALLDSLMGPSRDKDLKEQRRSDGWKEENVCKRYIIGFCPNNQNDCWFNARRRDLGLCTKVHSEALRKQFQDHPDREKHLPAYEKEFLAYLESVISEADASIAREKKKAAPAGVETRIPVHLKGTAKELKQQAEDCLKLAEEAAEKGDVEGSKRLTAQSGKLKEDLEDLKARYTYESTGENVCEVCGVRCLPGEQADYEAHLEGKLHLGYKKMRDKAQELREKRRAKETGSREGPRTGGRRSAAPTARGAAAGAGTGTARPSATRAGTSGGRDRRRSKSRDRRERDRRGERGRKPEDEEEN
ncbi:unnamed protein product [Prorocentrum cordatum]|uniref:Luc7-like protein 3 n=1 Tax=Prorocentrum cordatum TaxID=2364126 RepID=A0ABN9VZK1_9DINO|nr:unnamed protein product [Polarella glacialis]